jgi:hypothetical protein
MGNHGPDSVRDRVGRDQTIRICEYNYFPCASAKRLNQGALFANILLEVDYFHPWRVRHSIKHFGSAVGAGIVNNNDLELRIVR